MLAMLAIVVARVGFAVKSSSHAARMDVRLHPLPKCSQPNDTFIKIAVSQAAAALEVGAVLPPRNVAAPAACRPMDDAVKVSPIEALVSPAYTINTI